MHNQMQHHCISALKPVGHMVLLLNDKSLESSGLLSSGHTIQNVEPRRHCFLTVYGLWVKRTHTHTHEHIYKNLL